ncbi:MAG: MoaD/ThiS family protein [Coraliomargaritaceae bacterium]
MEITILYFARLAELAGKPSETRHIENSAINPYQLYAELAQEYRFPHAFEHVQVAINHQLARETTSLENGDTITFLPPMSGG